MSKAPPNAKCAGCGKSIDIYWIRVGDNLFHDTATCYRQFVEAEAKGTKRFNANEVK